MSVDITKGMAELTFTNSSATVKGIKNFNAREDSKMLHDAMKGVGTDENIIIELTSKRSREQRLQIANEYQREYKLSLKEALKSELSGDFRDLVLALYTPAATYDAKCLNDAMKGLGTNEQVLIEVLVTRSNDEIKEIKKAYAKEFQIELEKSIAGETSDDFRRFLDTLCNACREESETVDSVLATKDADALNNAGEKQLGTDEATFIRILCTRSNLQLRETFKEYAKVARKDIMESIKSEFSGDIENGLKAVIEFARCAPAYFAKLFHNAMKGAGTDEAAINRVVCARVEIDMVQIKEAFQTLYHTSLEEKLRDETSGDYKRMLLALIR